MCSSLSIVTCKKPHQKILFLAEVMNFSKSGLQLNYYRRANFKSRYLKTTFRYIFWEEWTSQNLVIWHVPSLGYVLQFEFFRFWNFYFFPFYGPILLVRGGHFGHFFDFFIHKNRKNKNKKNRKNSKCGNSLEEHIWKVSGLYLERFSQKMYLKVILSYRSTAI